MMGKCDSNNTLRHLNFVKAVLMIGVVLCHSVIFYGGGWFSSSLLPAANDYMRGFAGWLQSFTVECFTLVSGYIFCYIRYERGGYDNFPKFVKKKAFRLLLPYFSVALLWCIPIELWFHFDIKGVFHNFILGESPAQLWFLLMLFWVFLFAYQITKLSVSAQFIIVGLMFAIGTIAGALVPNYFQIITAFTYMLFFWTGFLIRKYKALTERRKLLWGGVILLVVNIALLCITKHLPGDTLSQKGLRYLVFEMSHYAGALMAFCLLLWGSIKYNCAGRLGLMSQLSFPIYLIHQQIIYVVLWNITSAINPYLGSLINFLIAMIVSAVICWLLLRYKYSALLLTGASPIKY